MKRLLIFSFILGAISLSLEAQIKFEDYFKRNTLRVDFTLAGDYEEANAYLEQQVVEPYWGGRKQRLDDFHGLGNYKFTLRDNLTDNIIYTDGFNTLFEEWQTSGEAQETKQSFYNSILMPLPFRKSTITIIRRDKGEFVDTLMVVPFDPESKSLKTATFPMYRSKSIRMTGSPDKSLDIVILAEGYIKEEVEVFYDHAEKFVADLFTAEVFRQNANRINIRAIASVSDHTGCDDPLQNVWAETVLNTSFNTIGMDRYLMTRDMKTVRDIAGMVPYDQIYIIVNTDKYGGGGIFNCVNVSSAKSHTTDKLIPHELGHGFGGLADEYTSAGMDYQERIDLSVEPWEANITTHIEDQIKWADFIKQNMPVPTPPDPIYKHTVVGVFEGAGNFEKGVWRPAYDCRMRSNKAQDFCPVCEADILHLIDFYTDTDHDDFLMTIRKTDAQHRNVQ